MMKTKNIRILMAALVMLSVASCQKEGVRTLTATFDRFESDGNGLRFRNLGQWLVD